MVDIKTYQDFLEVKDKEQEKMLFVFDVINEHRQSNEYINAVKNEKYYRGENPTIMEYEHIFYDVYGQKKVNHFKPNHKIASNFFNFAVTQEIQYLLGNGVTFTNKNTKEKLDRDFDKKIKDLAKKACVQKVSFGFFNHGNVEVMGLSEFVPLYDEEDGSLRAGVRFWQIDTDRPLRAVLYEENGYTQYIQRKGEPPEILQEKKTYTEKTVVSEINGEKIYDGENYESFPIIPMWANDRKESELHGRQGQLDAYDLLKSNLVNNVDQGNFIYWLVKNAGGMDDNDLEQLVERIKLTGVVPVQGENGATVDSRTVEIPYQASKEAIAEIKASLYEDFMCFNVESISSGSKTATEIEASYQNLEMKASELEYCVIDFINKILRLAKIDDKPSFTRSKIANTQQELDMVLASAEYIDDETIATKICNILGMGDQADEILQKVQAEEVKRLEPTKDPKNGGALQQ